MKKNVVIIDDMVYTYRHITEYKNAPDLEVYKILEQNYLANIKQVIIKDDLIYEQFIEGNALSECRHFDQKTKNKILVSLCKAISSLHRHNIIHRDIKPSNILVTNNLEVYLIDYDISRIYKPGVVSSDTTIYGTKGYAPPEQFGFMQTDFRSDIFALGVVMHEFCDSKDVIKIADICCQLDINARFNNIDEICLLLDKNPKSKKMATNKIEKIVTRLTLGFFTISMMGGEEGFTQLEIFCIITSYLLVLLVISNLFFDAPQRKYMYFTKFFVSFAIINGVLIILFTEILELF